MRSALVVAFSDLARDPRVLRQLAAMEGVFSVTTVGLGHPGCRVDRHITVPSVRGWAWRLSGMLLSLLRLDRLYASLHPQARTGLSALHGQVFDVIVANDLDTLDMCLKLRAPNSRVMFDAHEYAPLEFEDRWRWRLIHQPRLRRTCRRLLRRVDVMTTVSPGIAAAYKREFGATAVVVSNATAFQELEPSAMAGGRVRMIHHGVASPSRHPEEMIRMMGLLDERFTLDLMLMPGNPEYLASLKRLAAANPRIRFREPVPMPEIPHEINGYDVGLFMLPPVSLNNRFALPNKFFEFLQARLAIAIGPSPEMERLVNEHGLGVVARDFSAEAMAGALRSLTDDRIERFKRNSHVAAMPLSAQQNARLFMRLLGAE